MLCKPDKGDRRIKIQTDLIRRWKEGRTPHFLPSKSAQRSNNYKSQLVQTGVCQLQHQPAVHSEKLSHVQVVGMQLLLLLQDHLGLSLPDDHHWDLSINTNSFKPPLSKTWLEWYRIIRLVLRVPRCAVLQPAPPAASGLTFGSNAGQILIGGGGGLGYKMLLYWPSCWAGGLGSCPDKQDLPGSGGERFCFSTFNEIMWNINCGRAEADQLSAIAPSALETK